MLKNKTKKKVKTPKNLIKSFPCDLLKVYESKKYKKIRLGKDHDGGYIIYDNIPCDILFSCGILNDDSFEHEFTKKYNCKCIAFDGSIQKLPHPSPDIKFVKKFIGGKNTDKFTNLHELISENKNIILKMDIEGGEYPFLNSLPKKLLNKINMIAIEFHSSKLKWGYFDDLEKLNCFKKLNSTHCLCHIHGNNNGGVREYNGVIVPQVFECLYIKKKFVKDAKLNTEMLPSKLDMRNVRTKPEIDLNYKPFVN